MNEEAFWEMLEVTERFFLSEGEDSEASRLYKTYLTMLDQATQQEERNKNGLSK